HGAGSACGRAMSSAPSSTIGEQRRTNYALATMSEDAFVAAISVGQPVAPAYFGYAASTNRRTHQLLTDDDAFRELSLAELDQLREKGAVVIDGRAPEVFASGHLGGSINVSLDGRFAEYAGDVIEPGQPIVVVADPGREAEAKTRLARIGLDSVVGYLPDIEDVLVDHPDRAARALRLPVVDLASWMEAETDLQLVDVRNPSEHEGGIIPGACLMPLPLVREGLSELDPQRPTVVVCASGSRSSVAASLMRQRGFARVADLLGGFGAWTAAGKATILPAGT
ncbi:MAG TPA: rhodanese-like domain-containing protein, partial [Acidimicrobiales bacterium]|nr:rhodanese-like domain-containing protein [Acidimicrobiales bacterium]